MASRSDKRKFHGEKTVQPETGNCFMRTLSSSRRVLGLLMGAACACSSATSPARSAAGTYALVEAAGFPLPAPSPVNAAVLIVGGAFTLAPDGYYTLTEADSIGGTCRCRIDPAQRSGGAWAVDGSILTLTDTGYAGNSFTASIGANTIAYQTAAGSYRYTRR